MGSRRESMMREGAREANAELRHREMLAAIRDEREVRFQKILNAHLRTTLEAVDEELSILAANSKATNEIRDKVLGLQRYLREMLNNAPSV